MSDVRLVPMTREQRDHLNAFTDGSVPEELVAAWDAAPADPAGAIAYALAGVLIGHVSIPHGQEATDAVLAALGVPPEVT